MASLKEERLAIQRALDVIQDLTVYAHWPDSLELPAALIKPAMRREVTMDGGRVRFYEIELLVINTDQEEAQEILDEYLDDEGPNSVKAALEYDPTFGGMVSTSVYQGWNRYGARRTEAVNLLGVTIYLEVWE